MYGFAYPLPRCTHGDVSGHRVPPVLPVLRYSLSETCTISFFGEEKREALDRRITGETWDTRRQVGQGDKFNA